jgi:hypothetical protein
MTPDEVLLSVHAERAKRPEERAAWLSILARLATPAMVATLAVTGLSAPSPAESAPLKPPVMIMSNARRRQRGPTAQALDALAKVVTGWTRSPFVLA